MTEKIELLDLLMDFRLATDSKWMDEYIEELVRRILYDKEEPSDYKASQAENEIWDILDKYGEHISGFVSIKERK